MATPLKAAVKGLDALLRRCYRIREYSRDPDCLLRLAAVRSRRDLVLGDGTRVVRGGRVGDLHLWSERVPLMPPAGPSLAWAVAFQRRLRRSLELLADYVETDPGHRDLPAFRAVGSLMARKDTPARGAAAGGSAVAGPETLIAAIPLLAARLGLEILDVADPSTAGLWRRLASFWENAFNLALVWAYNPPSLKSRRLPGLRRVQLWISRRELVARYGPEDLRRAAGSGVRPAPPRG